jgi:formamidopyrimidine-DNA glycosylase
MIELPEAVVIAQQITDTLRGKRIARAVANASPHKFAWYTGDPENYQHLLPGKGIQGASAFGNHIEILAGEKKLVISTPIKFHAAGETPPTKHQLYLEFEDGSAVSCTVQMWGAMFCLSEGEEAGLPDYPIAKRRPSPLTDAFNRSYFTTLFNADTSKLSAKAFLATEQRIPGLGNGVLQDILWTAHIHPKRKMGDLRGEELDAMFAAVKQVLAVMTMKGGRDTERDLFDHPGGYKTILSKNTVDTACPVCGTIIRKEPYLGGAIYFCLSCQSL